MSTIRLGAAVNVRNFQNLLHALAVHKSHVLDPEALQDEFGRFRVWSGNLGALQKGHSSLDYRLRDAPLLSNEVSKLLKELEENLHAAHEIVTGARLPYEHQQQPESNNDEERDEDDFFSEDENEESDSEIPRTELSMRFKEVVDIVDNLYKISVRIRAPTVRTRSLKAASYQPKDPETGVDLLEQYAVFDIQHTQELVRHLRTPHVSDSDLPDQHDVLVDRLARAVTLRRRQFKYWRRHRDKLGSSTVLEEPQVLAAIQRPEAPHRHDTLKAQPGTPAIQGLPKPAPSQRTGKTLLSGTEATQHHQSLDDIVDSKSVTSYAVTVKDLSGKGIELPPPPKAADGDKDFECPYCFIICPARYGKGRPWRTHVLQDLQPYVCTYSECQTPDQLFRSRRDWVEHESCHRKAWRCPEHPVAVYKSQTDLEEHLRKIHGDSIPEGQLTSIVKVGETYTIDQRQNCPICCASVGVEGMGTLQNHIANHLERIAAFSLPTDVDDDSDGGSSRASHGRTEGSAIPTASGSSNTSDTSDTSDYNDKVNDQGNIGKFLEPDVTASSAAGPRPTQSNNSSQGLLYESHIRALPDDSGQRVDLLFSRPEEETESNESMEEESPNVTETEFEEHMTEREVFRKYLLSLPGAQSVRFYRRYGSWNGNINFRDGESAAMALRSFDTTRYPKVRLRQKDVKKETLKFSVLQHQQTKQVSFRSEVAIADTSPPTRVSSESQQPSIQGDAEPFAPILVVADIPNLRALYRSEELVQREDESYAPSDAYNEIISFVKYDITRLKVDAIVNSSNRALVPSKAEWTLNNIIHKAAGPGLQQECSRLTKLKVSQSVLTGGYGLPCTHIIHVARPHYASSKGMRQYNLLTAGYRSVLKLAMDQNLKTIAFCCLGTGGVGFPSRIAARIALQETREYLDAHQMHPFERIIFCVYAEDDSAAYTDFFPVFFPPTYEDLENASSTDESKNSARLSALIQEVYTQVDNVTHQVKMFGTEATNMPQRVAQELSSIAVLVESFKELVIRPNEEAKRLLSRMMRYLDLLCSVILAICGNMTEMVELAKGKENLGQPSYKVIWDDYNDHMYMYQGLTIVQLIDICKEFAEHLNDVLERNAAIPHEMKTIGDRLDTWLTKQTGKGPQSIRDHFEEVMLTREYQRDAPAKDRADTVKLYQIPTLAQLYDLGALQEKITHASPSARSNYIVCLTRDDITRLEVDILVSSTDTHFSGIGRLDRTVFVRGGVGLQEECANHAPCNEGEVILTGGYSLPVKHILHAILPAIYRADTQDVLRDMYRKILHMASYLKVTSIAIPSLGTGMLNYPRRDSAAIAIEEVKRFLESMDESNPIEKIVFVVYSSHDEFVYKSLIPVYFPALNLNAEPSEGAPIVSKPSFPLSRTLFGTIGEAFRKISSGKRSVASHKRPLEPSEEDALIIFETHAQGCSTCRNISTIYAEGKDLCDDGYRLAAQVLRHLYMKTDQSVHSLRSEDNVQAEVEISDVFPLSIELLSTVEKSFRDPDRDRPFVSNQPALGKLRRPEFTVYKIQVTVSTRGGRERTFTRIHIWSNSSSGWQNFQAPEPTLHLTRGAIVIRERDSESVSKELTRLYLNSRSTISRHSGTEILVDHVNADRALENDPGSRFTLTFTSETDCEMMLTTLKHAADNSPTAATQEETPPGVTIYNTEVTIPSRHEREKAFAQVSFWAHSARKWVLFNPYDSEVSLYITPGCLEIVANSFEASPNVRSRLILTPLAVIRKQSSVEILVDNVITEDKPTADIRRYMLRCSSQMDCDMLLPRLIHAAENSPYVEGSHSEEVATSPPLTSDAQHDFREGLGALNQRWKNHGKHLGELSIEPSAELDLPSVPKEDPMRRPGSAVESLSATEIGSAQKSGPLFPGFLEYRILTHIDSLPENRSATVDEHELTIALNETRIKITEAIERLRALNLITAVPDREHTWTTTKSQTIMHPVARYESYREPKVKIEEHDSEASESEPQYEPAVTSQ